MLTERAFFLRYPRIFSLSKRITIGKKMEADLFEQFEIERIAREVLDLETLKERRSDSLDFHELPVWTIRAALEAAFAAGRLAGRQ